MRGDMSHGVRAALALALIMLPTAACVPDGALTPAASASATAQSAPETPSLPDTAAPVPFTPGSPLETPAVLDTPKPDTNADGMPLVPDFALSGRGGLSFTLSEHQGRVVILNFFATWCPPCREEMPDLQAFYEGTSGEPSAAFYLIDLTDGQRETIAKADKYVDDNGITIPLLYDADGEAAALFGIYAIPTTVVIDKEGYLVDYIEGALSDVMYDDAPSTRQRFDAAVDKALR